MIYRLSMSFMCSLYRQMTELNLEDARISGGYSILQAKFGKLHHG